MMKKSNPSLAKFLFITVFIVQAVILVSCRYEEPYKTTDINNSTTDLTKPQDENQIDYEWGFADVKIAPEKARVGQPVTITAWLQVPGIVEQQGIAYLVIDGEVAKTQSVYVDADYMEEVCFTYSFEEVGVHEVRFSIVIDDDVPYRLGVNDLIEFIEIEP